MDCQLYLANPWRPEEEFLAGLEELRATLVVNTPLWAGTSMPSYLQTMTQSRSTYIGPHRLHSSLDYRGALLADIIYEYSLCAVNTFGTGPVQPTWMAWGGKVHNQIDYLLCPCYGDWKQAWSETIPTDHAALSVCLALPWKRPPRGGRRHFGWAPARPLQHLRFVGGHTCELYFGRGTLRTFGSSRAQHLL